ncbi:MAG: DUF2087 domain-containing protein [Chloroflexota bacterium]
MQKNPLQKYMDDADRITRWPTRKNKSDRALVLAYLATKFEAGTTYTEREVNDVLKQWHTFEDWALLRRELYEGGYLNREKDGSAYWPAPQTTVY